MMDYSLQLYSIRDITPDGMGDALKKVAALGYKYVETAGFFDITAQEMKAMLDENSLLVSGSHTGWKEVAEDFDNTVEYHKTIGNTLIIVPGADLSDQAKIDAFIEMANEFQPKLAEHGIRFGYHNHSHEFIPNADGSMIYDQIVERTSLLLEIDTFWAYAAGKDPIALMKQHAHRLPVIHIKDGFKDGSGKPLGQGTAPVAEVYKTAVEMGVMMVVESETLTPDGITEAKECIEYLRTLE